jgi:large subunit ribosomal protein L1
MDIGKAVREVKAGKIDFKVDKTGIIHASIGKVSFSPQQLQDNALEMINVISKLKPSSAKGTYFRTINMSSTMSSGVKIDKSTIASI